MTDLLDTVQTAGLLLGGWALLSVAGAAMFIPWLRSQALVNDALSRRDRSEDWQAAVHPANVRANEDR